MPVEAVHPTAEELTRFALGRLGDSAEAVVAEHLERCPECQHAAAGAPADPFVALLRSARLPGDTDAVAHRDRATSADGGGHTPAGDGGVPAILADHPRYRPIRPLGAGGMGVVWLAEHRVMGRPVAVKVVRPWGGGPAGGRFRREASAAARLHHPNIVAAYDAEDAGDAHLLAMEYLEGRTLAEEVGCRGPLPVAEACDAVRQAALGLQHAFERGLTHRDLKPHNLIRTPEGVVKVLDFGLASLADAAAGAGRTAPNVVMGTPDYIAPEQAEAACEADIRSDVYSLGCTLYHLLAGRVPFPGDSVLRKLDAHRGRTPEPLGAVRPDAPAALAAVVARMMAKRPEDRFQTPAEVAVALEPFATGSARAAPIVGRNRPRRRVAVATLCSALLLAAAAAGVIRIQTDRGEVVITPHSPDVEIVLLQGGKEVRVVDTRTGRHVRLPVGEYDVALKDAPEGVVLKTNRVEVRRGQEALVTVETVATRPPADPAANATTGAEPDLPRGGGGVELLNAFPWPQAGPARFSPDSTRFAVVGYSGGQAEVGVWEAQTGKRLGRFPLPGAKRHGAWPLPDGRLLVQVDGLLSRWDVGRGERLADLGVLPGEPGWQCNVADVSPDGRRICFLFSGRDPLLVLGLSVLSLETGKEEFRIGPLDSRSSMSPAPRFSPDGKLLAVADRSPAGSALRVYDTANGQRVHTIDVLAELGLSLVFGPDGRELAADIRGHARPQDGPEVRVWDVRTGERTRTVKLSKAGEGLERGAVLPGLGVYLGLHGRETVRVWELERGRLLHELRIPGLRVGAGGHSPDGRHLLLCDQQRVFVFRLPSGHEWP